MRRTFLLRSRRGHEPSKEIAKRIGDNMRALMAGEPIEHLARRNVDLFCHSVSHDAALLKSELQSGRINMKQYQEALQELRDMNQYISSGFMDVADKRGGNHVYSDLELMLEAKDAQLERLMKPKKSRWCLKG